MIVDFADPHLTAGIYVAEVPALMLPKGAKRTFAGLVDPTEIDRISDLWRDTFPP